MSQVHAEETAVVDADPVTVYAIFSDYEVAHPAILPRATFTGLTVEQGGQGAGTVVRLTMKVLGVEREFHQVVSEPEPGRVLTETDEKAGVVTTFTVEPYGDGSQSRVTIATDSEASPGFTGLIERLLNPMVLQRIYRQELQQLKQYIRDQRPT